MGRVVSSLIVALVFVTSVAEAGRGGGHSSRGPSGMRGTGSSSSRHAVRGYTKKSGTYVAPHRQTNADHSQLNNYSTKGNYNSSSGKTGSRYAAH